MTTEQNAFSFDLNKVLNWLGIERCLPDIVLTGLAVDSRRVNKGDLFCAIPGHLADGRLFIADAVERGAAAVLVEKSFYEGTAGDITNSPPLFFVPRLRERLGGLIRYLHSADNPVPQIYGVTGTNGKTSCCFYIAQFLTMSGQQCALAGTLGSGIFPQLVPSERTTEDVLTLHSFITDAALSGAGHLAMEVSSHGLYQHRVAGVPFDTVIYTNLSQDHLDYHGSMYNYAKAKSLLFSTDGLRHAVINCDDPYSGMMIGAVQEAVCITYSLADCQADVFASDIRSSSGGISATLHTPWGEGRLNTKLLGQFNLYNLIAAITALASNGCSFRWLLDRCSDIEPVTGRMQTIDGYSGQPMVVIDYAHTPVALASVLLALRQHSKGRLICVFGCGGDRDKGKRPLMAQEAELLSDIVIVTDDNPRHENSDAIISDILAGFSDAGRKRVQVINNRSAAIKTAIDVANTEDLILIAGKGHENYQETGDEKISFSDRDEVHSIFDQKIN